MQDKKMKKKGTFLVNVHYCENSTWQGTVTWAERNKKEYFKSALELMKLIDNSLEIAGMEDEDQHDEYEKKA